MSEARRGEPPADHVDGVLIIGAGYAGLAAARAAASDGAAVTVIEPTGRHDFVTRLAAVAGGTDDIDDASAPVESFGHAVIKGDVIHVADGLVELDDGRAITADSVVIATGSEATVPEIDGIEHARTLRTAEDAVGLRAELERHDAVTIIGGGATGVQLAGAISASGSVPHVRLVEAESRLLSSMTESSSAGAARILTDRDVEVLTDATVETISPDGVVVDGTHLAGLVVWAGGFTPRSAGLGVPLADDGRIRVDAELRVLGMARTFACGDVAAHTDDDGEVLPMSAQIAVQAGEGAGRNAARVARGDEPEAVDLGHRGWVLDLSGHRGIAEFGGVSLAGPFADLIPPFLHDAIDLKTLFELGGISWLR